MYFFFFYICQYELDLISKKKKKHLYIELNIINTNLKGNENFFMLSIFIFIGTGKIVHIKLVNPTKKYELYEEEFT